MSEQWFLSNAKSIDHKAMQSAQERQMQLTKPPGSLGVLEEIGVRFSGFQSNDKPVFDNIFIAIMAADHGIAEEGVSAFPQAVTAEMIKNFASGGAAISVLARQHSAVLQVYNLGTVVDLPEFEGVSNCIIGKGTANFAKQPAMSEDQLLKAMQVGKDAAESAEHMHAHVFVGGEMGIANTSSAACLVSSMHDIDIAELVGPGTGLDDDGVNHKKAVLRQALEKHHVEEPLDLLMTYSGFEIAALVGAYIRCAQIGVPVIVDGYICTAAAIMAVAINPTILPWLIVSHCSAEPAHRRMLEILKQEPLVDLKMRLGEGSGAALILPLIHSACKLQSEMATFADAGVSEKSP